MSETSMMTPAKTPAGLVLGGAGHSGSPILQGVMTSSGGIILTPGSSLNSSALLAKGVGIKTAKKAVSINQKTRSG